MQNYLISARSNGKQYAAIKSLPDHPKKKILWIVYNEDMVKYTEKLIAEIKGESYMQYISVVSRQQSSKKQGTVYFDPLLMDHIGNGNA